MNTFSSAGSVADTAAARPTETGDNNPSKKPRISKDFKEHVFTATHCNSTHHTLHATPSTHCNSIHYYTLFGRTKLYHIPRMLLCILPPMIPPPSPSPSLSLSTLIYNQQTSCIETQLTSTHRTPSPSTHKQVPTV